MPSESSDRCGGTLPSTPPPASESPPAAVAATGPGAVSITDGPSSSDFGFSPSSITVDAGATVTWTNTGTTPAGHTVTGSGFGSGTLHSGQSFSHTFTTPGTFSYMCSIHNFMKGSVTVAAAPTGGDAGAPGFAFGFSATSARHKRTVVRFR